MTAESPRHRAGHVRSGLMVGRLTRIAAPSAAVLAVAVGLAGCKGVVVASSPAGASPAAAIVNSTVASSAAPAASVAATAGGAASTSSTSASSPAQTGGSVSVSVTSPVAVSGAVSVPVSCVSGVAYRATLTSAVVHGDQVSFSVLVPRYRGPGSYPAAVVGLTLRQASGVVTTVAGVSGVPAEITSAGGSFSVSVTGSGGRTLTGSLNWTCGA